MVLKEWIKCSRYICLVTIFLLSQNIQCSSQEISIDVLASAPSLAKNKSPDKTKCDKVRKEFTYMSIKDRERFVNAYKKVTTTEPFKTRFKSLIMDHPKLAPHIHNKAQFLPWHRLFLLNFEKLLADVDPSVTLPYWDWSLSHQSPWRASILDIWSAQPWGLGGNGDDVTHCVMDGPFASDKWSIATNHGKAPCLKRKFNGVFPGIITIHRALRFDPSNFTQFEDFHRNFLHDAPHWRIGGTMGDKYGSRAPEFLLHHAFLDKIWADYQKQSPEHKWAYFRDIKENIYNTNIPVRRVVDNQDLLGIKICYKDPFDTYSDTQKSLTDLDLDTIRSLVTKEAYTQPYFERYLKY